MSYVYLDFQCSITHASGDRIVVQLQDKGTQGKQLSATGLSLEGRHVQCTQDQAQEAFRLLRQCLVDFLPA